MQNKLSFLFVKLRLLLKNFNTRQKALLALVLILPAPLIGVSSSLYLPSIETGAQEIEIGKFLWGVAKLWLLLFPLAWLVIVDNGKLSWSPTGLKGVLAGLLWSIPVSLALLGAYWVSKGGSLVDPEATSFIKELGLTTPARFLIFASAMSLGNSLMEEYVWRWFVFSRFKILVGIWPSILLSAFFFTVHHVVIMWAVGSIWLILAGSLALFLGGIIWGYLYAKYNSIWPGWICHVAADTTIMWVTWQILTSN